MSRAVRGLTAAILAISFAPGPAAFAGSDNDPPPIWGGEFKQDEGTASVGAEHEVVEERRSWSSDAKARPAIVSWTSDVPVCGTPADPVLTGEVTGRSISCEGVPCTTAGGRPGEKRFSVTKQVEVAPGRVLGATEMGPVRCVALSRAPVSLDELVRRQFREVRLPGSVVRTDPTPWTLVNLPTSFVAEQPWTERDIGRVLGRRVSVTITPVAYHWLFGDGTAEEANARAVDHTYAGSGAMPVSVETTYRATYRVAGGRARTIPGTVSVPGPVTSLDVYEARSQLVAGPPG